jgi:hypothetical protein
MALLTHAIGALAADVPLKYLIEERPLRTTDASASVQIALFTDAACTASAFSTTLRLGDIDLLARVPAMTPRGSLAPVKAAEIRHTLRDVTAASPLYARVVGSGIVPVGGECQVQSIPVPPRNMPVLVDEVGTVLGPYGVATDLGRPIWLRAAGQLTYAIAVESNVLYGTTSSLYFEAPDCSSPPLIYADYYSQELFYPSVSRDRTLYHPAGTPTERVVTAKSEIGGTPAQCMAAGGAFVPPHHCCQAVGAGQTFRAQFIETGTFDLGQFVFPLHVELR